MSSNEYDLGFSEVRDFVNDALTRDDVVVLQYVDGFHVCRVDELVCIATTPNGHLILLEKNGAMTTFNTGTDQMRSQRVPLDMFVAGPNDASEVVAVWNEFKQKRDKALLDEAIARGEM